ncbi:MAG: DUF3276 family protein [Chitinophagaceae bacterium]|nr:DUF3276 family protein [Chitinophagaceae bacterium]
MAYDNNEKKMESVYSQRIRAGKRRTYFFDVRETRGNDFYLTITESRKRFDSDGYDRHKIFLYKEDFNKFIKGLGEAIDYVKTELMPDFDFDAFNHDTPYEGEEGQSQQSTDNSSVVSEPASMETVVSDLTETIPEIPETPVTEMPAAETPDEEDNGPVDNGSSEVAEKW